MQKGQQKFDYIKSDSDCSSFKIIPETTKFYGQTVD